MEALVFLQTMEREYHLLVDVALFDPPYSPRQVVECYQGIGRVVEQGDTNNSSWRSERDVLNRIVKPGGVVLSFGWNSCGMGINRGFDIEEILIVCHGGGHNDTICMAERKRDSGQLSISPGGLKAWINADPQNTRKPNE